MIKTYSSTIRRKEMDAVLTCMVDEKLGPGEINLKLIQQIKENFSCDGAIALRSPSIALKYILIALNIEKKEKIMISALAPSWQYTAIKELGYEPLVLDVEETTGLVSVEKISEGLLSGGKVLLLHETGGILPDFENILNFNIPIIEDISQSYGASFYQKNENGNEISKKQAGTFGLYTILGLEEHDVVTSGGGAILFSKGRKEWTVMKNCLSVIPSIDMLPDINSALAYIQLKEFNRNEKIRKEIYANYQHACLIGRHKMFMREMDDKSTVSCFSLILNSSFKDVKQYAGKKDIEVRLAYEDSVIAQNDELSESCIHAKSLFLRCVHFPLYPRLSSSECSKIIKVLGSLP
ncbi:MAG: DegT/DnrJ/EryC1/StrS aminotransferase family protein [Treponema sp.]|nr:DegT/DnrJ/EryC1/StrS aminotransferase family protein [Treponema sp.]